MRLNGLTAYAEAPDHPELGSADWTFEVWFRDDNPSYTHPRARILTLVFVFLLPIPAVIVLGEWFLVQFLAGINTLGGGPSGGVAVMAHVGGFLLGMLITAMVRWR